MFLFKKSNRRNVKKLKNRKSRSFGAEMLEARDLMAADIALSNGILSIQGDNNSETITVRTAPFVQKASFSAALTPVQSFGSVPLLQLQVTVVDNSANTTTSEYFSPWLVNELVIDTGNGTNTVNVQVAIPATITGGGGIDRIYGGSADDIIFGGGNRDYLDGRGGEDSVYGQSGNDYLFGGSHADLLDGGPGIDRLYGQNGDDELIGGTSTDYLYGGNHDDILRGGSSRDYLYGQNGDDQLVGDSGNDVLNGGNDDDALIGGIGADSMISGSGRDRFLVTQGDGDTVADKSTLDAKINFINTTSDQDVLLGSNIGEVTAEADSWTSAEIETIDESFQLLFDATGNNELLKKHDGTELQFIRYGDIEDSDGDENTSVLGWNGGDEIVVINNAFESGWIAETVIHEIAHNFDEQHENSFVDDFRDAGTWQHLAFWQSKSGYTAAEDDNWGGFWSGWYYETSSTDEFARTYGQMNPLEDFATAFTAKILSDSGNDYFSESAEDVQDRMGGGDRFEVLDDFFASLS